MPRYLTASKLALLLLIDTYTTLDLSSAARHGVLNLLAANIVIRSDSNSNSLHDRFHRATSNDIASFADAVSSLPANIPGQSVYDVFLTKVWALDGLDAATDAVRRVAESARLRDPDVSHDQSASSPRISRASPLGQFIRRSHVEFTRLQFADAQALWGSFAAFRSSSHDAWARRNPEAAQIFFASQAPWAPSPSSPPEPTQLSSTEDTSLLLSFSIHHLQKLGHRLPPGLKANLSAFLSQAVDSNSQSLQHFLAFFDHWRAGQYTMALESLHRYYDYSIASQGGSRDFGKEGTGPGGAKVFYQYALLHLSVLHADFERWEASVAAMEECVATARESQDTPCLLLALSWLLYLRHAHSTAHTHSSIDAEASLSSFGNLAISSSTQADEIAFLKTKARDMKAWALLSSALIDEARSELVSGTATPKALEHLLQAQHLNTTHSLHSQQPATLLFQAAAFERLGQNTLAHNIYANVSLLHRHTIPLPERVRAGCRLAQSFDQRGEHQRAIATLDELESTLDGQGTLKSRQRVMGWRTVLRMKRALRRDDLPTAIQHNASLRPFLFLSSDPDLSFEIFTLGVKLQLQQDRRADALKAVNERIRAHKRSAAADLAQTLALLLLKARIFVCPPPPSINTAASSSSSTTSAKAFSITLRAAATAQRSNLVPLLCEAVDLLGRILVDLGEYEAARGLIEGMLPTAIETSSLTLQRDLYSTLTDALVGVAHSPSPFPSASTDDADHSQRQGQLVSQAAIYLDHTLALSQHLEDFQSQLDCLVKQRLLADCKGDNARASEAESVYFRVVKQKEREMKSAEAA